MKNNFFNILLISALILFQQTADSAQIVPKGDQISDFEAELSLATIQSHHKITQNQALIKLEKLMQERPDDIRIHIELGRLYIALKRNMEGLQLLYSALDANPENLELLIATAQAEATAGHPQKSHDLFLIAIDQSEKKEPILINYADAMMQWGDFYKAEDIYRTALSNGTDTLENSLKLAWALISSQRYEEADGLYRTLFVQFP